MSTFRLATVNVHSFRNSFTYESNVSALVSILAPLNLDLLVVQETKNTNEWKEFCSHLSFPYSNYGQCKGDFFGNGMASRYPILSYSNQQSSFDIPAERRSLLQFCLDGDHLFIQNRLFAVTHLDHLDEDDRLKQIKDFNPPKDNIDILMGDMNALTREDYSEVYYQNAIVEVRAKSVWEKPRFDLTKLISDTWGYQDAYKSFNPEKKDEQVATCDYGTRIDYIYVHPRVNDQWTLKDCQIIDTKGFTDHKAVFAEFELKSK